MSDHFHEGYAGGVVCALVVGLIALGFAIGLLDTVGGQSHRDARRIDRIEQQLNIPGPDVPTPAILDELHALQTEVAK